MPVYVRAHNLLTTGDGTPALKWGSTNAYTEDADGRPIYDWTIVDRIIDTYVEREMKPLVEIGFMPEALSTQAGPYRHDWKPGDNYNDIYTGWAYPPKDYDKWRELIYQWVKHSVEKYGQKEVESWWWEVWNEPDIGYWRGTPEEFLKLYDYAADGLKRALPTARIGGPHVTGPNGARTQEILRNFIEHCLRGTNYATGKIGTPLDFVGFHAKGAPRVMPDGHVRMSVSNQLRAIANGFSIVASFPELKNTPIIIGESDPEGCAACHVRTNPENAYRNGTMYSSYTAEQLARTYELADLHGVNLLGSVTWAFEFEEQPYFDGFRDLATNGIDKPVLNVFRMLGQMRGDRVAVESTGACRWQLCATTACATGRRLRAGGARRALGHGARLELSRRRSARARRTGRADHRRPAQWRPTLTHYRVDREHSNSYEVWKKNGLAAAADAGAVRGAGKGRTAAHDARAGRRAGRGGRFVLPFTLPRQGVSLVKLTW